MSNPLISVLLPVYNEEKYISQSIDSILNQTYRNFELIIIDDCSTDKSNEIINSYNDSRIILIKNKKNLHIAKSLNIGFQHANGEFIARIDANDIAVNTRFEKQMNYLLNHPKCAVIFCPVLKIDVDGNSLDNVSGNYIPYELIQTWLFYKNCFFHTAAMMRKLSLPEPPYDESNFAEDYGLWIDLARNWELHILNEVLMKVRDLPGGLRTTKEIVKSYNETKLRQLKWLDIIPNERESGIHLGLEQKKYDDDQNKILEKIKWLDKIYLANQNHFIFEEPYFSDKLVEHWNTVVNNFNRLSFETFWVYYTSPLRKVANKPFKRTLKLFLSIFSTNSKFGINKTKGNNRVFSS